MMMIMMTYNDVRDGFPVFASSKYDSIRPLLHQMHWLKATENPVQTRAVLTFRCLHDTAPYRTSL